MEDIIVAIFVLPILTNRRRSFIPTRKPDTPWYSFSIYSEVTTLSQYGWSIIK